MLESGETPGPEWTERFAHLDARWFAIFGTALPPQVRGYLETVWGKKAEEQAAHLDDLKKRVMAAGRCEIGEFHEVLVESIEIRQSHVLATLAGQALRDSEQRRTRAINDLKKALSSVHDLGGIGSASLGHLQEAIREIETRTPELTDVKLRRQRRGQPYQWLRLLYYRLKKLRVAVQDRKDIARTLGFIPDQDEDSISRQSPRRSPQSVGQAPLERPRRPARARC
jgi:hypothetical protein